MSKHKLYSSNQNSPMLNQSSNESTPKVMKRKHCEEQTPVKGSNDEAIAKSDKNEKEGTNLSDLDSTMDESDFFSTTIAKLPYTQEEDELILSYVLKGQNIFKVSSISLWKQLECKKDNPKRTYQSLKNRFLRNIKPHLFTRYNHLVKGEELIQNIIKKFPELKKDVGRRGDLTGLKLPRRKGPPKITEDDKVSSTCPTETLRTVEREAPVQTENIPTRSEKKTPGQKANSSQRENFTRKVELKNDSITVTFNRGVIPRKTSSSIYETYLKHKESNVLVPCPMCGRCGGPEDSRVQGSDNESDDFIKNSVESSKTSKSSQEEKKSKKRKKESQPVIEPLDSNPLSLSLLKDISEVKELSQSLIIEEENKEASQSVSSSNLGTSTSNQGNSKDLISQKDLDSLYEETIAHCERLVDSEEEEALVFNCLRKNCKAFGFRPDLSVGKGSLEAFFVQSHSPTLEHFTSDESETRSENTKGESAIVLTSPLAQNMARMLDERTKKK